MRAVDRSRGTCSDDSATAHQETVASGRPLVLCSQEKTRESTPRAVDRSRGTCSGDLAAEHEKITVCSWLLQAGSNHYFTHNTYSQAVQLLPTSSHPESGHPRVNLTLTGLQKDLSIVEEQEQHAFEISYDTWDS